MSFSCDHRQKWRNASHETLVLYYGQQAKRGGFWWGYWLIETLEWRAQDKRWPKDMTNWVWGWPKYIINSVFSRVVRFSKALFGVFLKLH